jgi:hypothetical protein
LAGNIIFFIFMPPNFDAAAVLKNPNSASFMYASVFFIYVMIVQLTFYYKIWKALPPSIARTTPGKAVVLTLIPVFNWYWTFQVLWGWAKDFNRFVTERGLKIPAVSEKVALLSCILNIVGTVVGFIYTRTNLTWFSMSLTFICLTVFLTFLWQAVTAVNLLPTEVRQQIKDERLAFETAKWGVTAPSQAMGIISMVLGILSILLPYLGIATGALALLFAWLQKKRGRSPFAKAGRICGIIGIVFWILITVAVVLIVHFSRVSRP